MLDRVGNATRSPPRGRSRRTRRRGNRAAARRGRRPRRTRCPSRKPQISRSSRWRGCRGCGPGVPLEEPLRDVRSDETRAAGDQRFQERAQASRFSAFFRPREPERQESTPRKLPAEHSREILGASILLAIGWLSVRRFVSWPSPCRDARRRTLLRASRRRPRRAAQASMPQGPKARRRARRHPRPRSRRAARKIRGVAYAAAPPGGSIVEQEPQGPKVVHKVTGSDTAMSIAKAYLDLTDVYGADRARGDHLEGESVARGRRVAHHPSSDRRAVTKLRKRIASESRPIRPFARSSSPARMQAFAGSTPSTRSPRGP